MINKNHRRVFYYGKTKENCTQSANDRSRGYLKKWLLTDHADNRIRRMLRILAHIACRPMHPVRNTAFCERAANGW